MKPLRNIWYNIERAGIAFVANTEKDFGIRDIITSERFS